MTTAAPRPAPPASRRPASAIITTPTPIAKGATARSAIPPRANGAKSPPPRAFNRGGSPVLNGDESRETLIDSLRREMDQKEQLLLQLQNKESTVSELTTENDHLSSALNSAESRLAELYADQTRVEEEMAARIEVTEKLRVQARELEKERRDLQRRYNEQTATFEAERQSFYDNEQHLKSRILSLSQTVAQARQQAVPPSPSVYTLAISDAEDEENVELETPIATRSHVQDLGDHNQEPAEITSLKLELSTLSTSHASLQSTLMLLQSQLVDLKRMNNTLQEENESYMILLREKTLSGQYDVLRQMGGDDATSSSVSDGDEDDVDVDAMLDAGSLRSSARSALDPVEEAEEEQYAEYDHQQQSQHQHHELDPDLTQEIEVQEQEGSPTRPSRHRRRGTGSISHSSVGEQRGESLAGLPITGPGLDLAAELGRAENKDIFSDNINPPPTPNDPTSPGKSKRGRKSTTARAPQASSLASELAASTQKSDVETLRSEVRALKDANKALSLYASKIIDRIIAQEGFEHVLAIDYEKEPDTPSGGAGPKQPPSPVPAPEKPKKSRPQSFFGMSSSSAQQASSPLDQPDRPTAPAVDASTPPLPPPGSTAAAAAKRGANRRSFSLDWSSFSIFSGGGAAAKPAETGRPSLRPLTLKPGASSLPGPAPGTPGGAARKLDTFEDDEDRKERERLAATMKLMGIEKPASSAQSPMLEKSYSTPTRASEPMGAPDTVRPPLITRDSADSATSPSPAASRWTLFRSRSTKASSETSSLHSPANASGANSPKPSSLAGVSTAGLTQEALERAEAEEKLAALDAHERSLSEQLAKGGSGGFTEIAPRRLRAGRSVGGSGSGSTVWSAGMSKGEDED